MPPLVEELRRRATPYLPRFGAADRSRATVLLRNGADAIAEEWSRSVAKNWDGLVDHSICYEQLGETLETLANKENNYELPEGGVYILILSGRAQARFPEEIGIYRARRLNVYVDVCVLPGALAPMEEAEEAVGGVFYPDTPETLSMLLVVGAYSNTLPLPYLNHSCKVHSRIYNAQEHRMAEQLYWILHDKVIGDTATCRRRFLENFAPKADWKEKLLRKDQIPCPLDLPYIDGEHGNTVLEELHSHYAKVGTAFPEEWMYNQLWDKLTACCEQHREEENLVSLLKEFPLEFVYGSARSVTMEKQEHAREAVEIAEEQFNAALNLEYSPANMAGFETQWRRRISAALDWIWWQGIEKMLNDPGLAELVQRRHHELTGTMETLRRFLSLGGGLSRPPYVHPVPGSWDSFEIGRALDAISLAGGFRVETIRQLLVNLNVLQRSPPVLVLFDSSQWDAISNVREWDGVSQLLIEKQYPDRLQSLDQSPWLVLYPFPSIGSNNFLILYADNV